MPTEGLGGSCPPSWTNRRQGTLLRQVPRDRGHGVKLDAIPTKATPATYSDTWRVPTESFLMGVDTRDALPLTSHQQVGGLTTWLLFPASIREEEGGEFRTKPLGVGDGGWARGWDSLKRLGQAKGRLHHPALCPVLPKYLNFLAAANKPTNGLPCF